MILCLAANPSVDKLFEVQEITHGEIHRPLHFVAAPGGKGLNVARTVVALGGHALASGLLAGHVGRWVQEALAAESVQTHFVWTEGETRASLSVADRETGRLTEFYEDASPVAAADWAVLEDLVAELVAGVSWLSVSGSLPPGAPPHGYARFVAHARKRGTPVALDSRGSALPGAVEAGPDLTKINALEAAEMLERPVDGLTAVVEAAQALRERAGGAGRVAVVTMGAEGAVLVDDSGEAWHGHSEARGRYPVGCGDVFLGAMLTALDRGQDWPQALALGIGASAANAQMPGTGRFDPEQATRLAREATIARV
jgi:1-phosphofructokinase family hexose kinase